MDGCGVVNLPGMIVGIGVGTLAFIARVTGDEKIVVGSFTDLFVSTGSDNGRSGFSLMGFELSK